MSGAMQQQARTEKPEVFRCGACERDPIEPVVTECGHIFCWKCISKFHQNSFECPTCETVVATLNCYPIFIQHEESKAPDSQHPSRPSPNYREKIINMEVGNSNLPVGLTYLQSNMEARKQVPGSSYIPSMITNSFVLNQIEAPAHTARDARIFAMCGRFTACLGALLLSTVVLVLIF